jgi:hypothetical protein
MKYGSSHKANATYLSPFDAQWEAIAARADRAAQPETGSSQRRLGERVCLAINAIIVFAHGSAVTQTRDVSSSGCAVGANVPEYVGEVLILLTGAPGHPPLALEARRVRSLSEGTAFEFVKVNDIDRLSLGELLDRVLSRSVAAARPDNLVAEAQPSTRIASHVRVRRDAGRALH